MHSKVVEYESGLPVGFHRVSGELVSFEDALSDPTAVEDTSELSTAQQKALAEQRIEGASAWPEREFHPGGRVDAERALIEIERGGEIGDLLVETEVRVAAWVVARLLAEAADG